MSLRGIAPADMMFLVTQLWRRTPRWSRYVPAPRPRGINSLSPFYSTWIDVQYLSGQELSPHPAVHWGLHYCEDLLHAQRKRFDLSAKLHPRVWYRSVRNPAEMQDAVASLWMVLIPHRARSSTSLVPFHIRNVLSCALCLSRIRVRVPTGIYERCISHLTYCDFQATNSTTLFRVIHSKERPNTSFNP